ncbi:MAG: Nuclease [Planctomycetota bacterium]|nr:Nuclease [Planctomycetota bacterium]
MPRVFRRLIAVAAILSLVSPAHAWGPQGHRISTRIAMARLTPKAAGAIRELLNPGDTLVDVCNWADHEGHDVVPDSAPWHYVNVPLDAPRYSAKYCGERGCVVSKIKEFRKILADPKAPRKERQRALLFLVHFVEDVHQPLHVGDNRDRGGNNTQVQFAGKGTNLHRVWDSDILHHVGGNDNVWVQRLTPLLTPEHVKAWSSGSVEEWADESLIAARKAYMWPPGSRTPMPSGTILGNDYVRMADPIVRERLAQAGVRLANELNGIFK